MDLKELERIAHEKLKQYRLDRWTYSLAKTKRRLGVCKYRSRRIEISEYYARHSPASTVIDTLLHEIAHALAGPSAGHGPVWKGVAELVGATPRACETSGEAVVQPGDWQVTCVDCKKTHHHYRQPRSRSGYRCTCKSEKPMFFEYVGDPALRPRELLSERKSAPWKAHCSGCGAVHERTRKPKPGVWLCRCSRRCRLAWRFQAEP